MGSVPILASAISIDAFANANAWWERGLTHYKCLDLITQSLHCETGSN